MGDKKQQNNKVYNRYNDGYIKVRSTENQGLAISVIGDIVILM
jgi:hypothetical protein